MMMATSQVWEPMQEDAVEIDGNLLMELLEESHLQETENGRLGCDVGSPEEEIVCNAVGGAAEMEREDHHHLMDCGILESAGLEDGHFYSRSERHIDDPFYWVDLDLVAESQYCDEMGSWYAQHCGYEDEFVDAGDSSCSPFYCGDYSSVDNVYGYSPLWQETYDSM